jgi:hypothetical protein
MLSQPYPWKIAMPCNLRAAFFATVLILVPSAAHAQASKGELAEFEDARVIVQAVVPETGRTESLQGAMKSIGSQMVQSGLVDSRDPGMARLFDEFMAELPDRLRPAIDAFGIEMADAMAQAYVREFSASELKDIRKFAQTPAGSHYLGASMKMLEDPAVAVANQRFLASLESNLDPIMADWDRRIGEYRAQKQASAGEPVPVIANYPPLSVPAPAPTLPPAPPEPPR